MFSEQNSGICANGSEVLCNERQEGAQQSLMASRLERVDSIRFEANSTTVHSFIIVIL